MWCVVQTSLPPIAPVLAHQGGWDEMLMLASPILVFLAVRWVARRRERREEREVEQDE